LAGLASPVLAVMRRPGDWWFKHFAGVVDALVQQPFHRGGGGGGEAPDERTRAEPDGAGQLVDGQRFIEAVAYPVKEEGELVGAAGG
jgi:hypothetical protein